MTQPHPHELFVKTVEETNPSYGCVPLKREINEYLETGMIILDKPSGPISHEVANQVKKYFLNTRIDKVGHGGTLDPNATGVLPLTLNKASAIQEIILSSNKEYVGTMWIHEIKNKQLIEEALEWFRGKIYQYPPDRSAIQRILRIREIYSLEMLELTEKKMVFRVTCEAGTYIRKLCVDLGEVLECGGHLIELRRTQSGNFNESQAVTLSEIEGAIKKWKEEKDESSLRKIVIPMEEALVHFPQIIVKDSAVNYICRGANVKAMDVLQVEKTLQKNEIVAIYTQKGEIIALGRSFVPSARILEAKSGYMVNNLKVLMESGKYP